MRGRHDGATGGEDACAVLREEGPITFESLRLQERHQVRKLPLICVDTIDDPRITDVGVTGWDKCEATDKRDKGRDEQRCTDPSRSSPDARSQSIAEVDLHSGKVGRYQGVRRPLTGQVLASGVDCEERGVQRWRRP